MRDLTTSEKFGYVAKKVFTSPLSLLIWAVGGVACVFLAGRTQSPAAVIPLVAAALGQLFLLFGSLHNEEYLKRIFQERQQHEEVLSEQQIETLLESMDFETRQRVRYILQLYKEVLREARAPDVESYAKKDLEQIADQLAPLIQRAVRLATRKQQLARYLHNVDERALKSYCTSLKQRIETTSDPVTKAQYEQALKAREAELNTYQGISQATARIDSQLENVEATFASWKAKVIRIKTADVASAANVREGLYQELGDLNSQIDLLDTSVTEALAADDEAVLRQGT